MLAEAVAPPFSPAALLRGWDFEPLVVLPIFLIGVAYLLGYRRLRQKHGPVFPTWRACCFIASLVFCFIAVDGPLDVYADLDIAVHMGQHDILLFVVPALAVLGAPAVIALRAFSPAHRARYVLPLLHNPVTRFVTTPTVAGSLYAGDLLASHFTGWYNLALENQQIHDLEHLSYLACGFLLWEVVVGIDPIPHRATPPQRIKLLFAEMPVMAVIGVVFIVATHPLYPYYTGLPQPWGSVPRVLASQQLAGVIMWVPSVAVSVAGMLYIAVTWFEEDESRRRRADALNAAMQHVADYPGTPAKP